MSTFGHRSDTITKAREAARALFNAFDLLSSAKVSWDGGIKNQIVDATGADPEAVGYKPGDFAGANQGLIKADFTQALGPAYVALKAFIDSADGKKLEDIR